MAIARYTATQWGKPQSLRYAALLDQRFCQIAKGTAYARTFSKRYPDVLVTRCEHHYVFYIHPNQKPPRIIAVLHVSMDIVSWLENRLNV